MDLPIKTIYIARSFRRERGKGRGVVPIGPSEICFSAAKPYFIHLPALPLCCVALLEDDDDDEDDDNNEDGFIEEAFKMVEE